ncbi:uncharacterized protein LOC131597556 [Vicia villosa]|uniref:uncharacterized protein LOC131597556 n=1 Tax=Vicia villosa TaxID=3911 RepID=UPI00273A7E7F|nr:uncharacterized protein LOC131597556 [Vicia villosa]
MAAELAADLLQNASFSRVAALEATEAGLAAVDGGAGTASVPIQQLAAELQSLLAALNPVLIKDNTEDNFSWAKSSSGSFTVKSCYEFFKKFLSGQPMESDKVKALNFLWKFKVPPKILCFAWRFLLNRLATRDQLVRRGVLEEGIDSSCALCGFGEESLSHLFFLCKVSVRIWRRVFMWLDLSGLLSFEEFGDFFYNFRKIPCLNKCMIVGTV